MKLIYDPEADAASIELLGASRILPEETLKKVPLP
jgi:hypothetical protein